MPDDLRSRIDGRSFDYSGPLNALREYAGRGTGSRCSSGGEIIRVKKGIYVFGEASGLGPSPGRSWRTCCSALLYFPRQRPLLHGLIRSAPRRSRRSSAARAPDASPRRSAFSIYRPLSLGSLSDRHRSATLRRGPPLPDCHPGEGPGRQGSTSKGERHSFPSKR